MNKQVILIYDLETNKILDVQDVRSMTPEKFAEFQKEARKNRIAKVKADQKKVDDRMQEVCDTFNFYAKKIDALQRVIAHILGLKELDEETIKKYIEFENQKTIDELNSVPPVIEPNESESNESEEESDE